MGAAGMNLLGYRKVAVPHDLSEVTHIDHAAEAAPDHLGVRPGGIDRIWSAVEQLYRTGLQPAITLVVRRRGQIVMKRAIGCLRGNGPGERADRVPLSPDAPICLFSASKAISALLVHKLAEDRLLRLDDRVADFIPEFAAHGKDRVTIRQLLAHRAGIPQLPIKHPDPSLLRHWDAMVSLLCLAPPFDPRFEKQAYHALTGGFIVGELVRRVGKIELREALQQWLAEPLGLNSLSFGLPPERRAQAPLNYLTGPKPVWPITKIAERVLGVDFARAVSASNDDAYLSAIVPAGNLYASADDACRIFEMLRNGGTLDGHRVLSEATVAEAVKPVGRIQIDGMLNIPMRFSPAFMLGENPVGLWGPKSRDAFGHIGFMTVLCWADPARELSVAILNNGKSVAPTAILQMAKVVGAITRACPRLR
ncbi:MAG: class A beta-lactamase-related serine hydrolase [Nevskiaceae bacterium]|nr:MAG: class A beta-lactamase-related serine hydrolase [Nevskiaceae bacterium]